MSRRRWKTCPAGGRCRCTSASRRRSAPRAPASRATPTGCPGAGARSRSPSAAPSTAPVAAAYQHVDVARARLAAAVRAARRRLRRRVHRGGRHAPPEHRAEGRGTAAAIPRPRRAGSARRGRASTLPRSAAVRSSRPPRARRRPSGSPSRSTTPRPSSGRRRAPCTARATCTRPTPSASRRLMCPVFSISRTFTSWRRSRGGPSAGRRRSARSGASGSPWPPSSTQTCHWSCDAALYSSASVERLRDVLVGAEDLAHRLLARPLVLVPAHPLVAREVGHERRRGRRLAQAAAGRSGTPAPVAGLAAAEAAARRLQPGRRGGRRRGGGGGGRGGRGGRGGGGLLHRCRFASLSPSATRRSNSRLRPTTP